MASFVVDIGTTELADVYRPLRRLATVECYPMAGGRVVLDIGTRSIDRVLDLLQREGVPARLVEDQPAAEPELDQPAQVADQGEPAVVEDPAPDQPEIVHPEPEPVRHAVERRCSRCREVKPLDQFASGAKYCRPCATAYNLERRKGKTLDPDDERHGTVTGYVNWACRCAPCTAAKAKQARAHRRAAREQRQRERAEAQPEQSAPPPPAPAKRKAKLTPPPATPPAPARPAAKRATDTKRTTAAPQPAMRPGPFGGEVTDWRRREQGYRVLEVVDEISDAEVERILRGGA